MMKESMTADVRAKAGLGLPPKRFYTNDSETNNERIKHKMDHREAGLCSFVAGMKQLAYSQETEFAKALCGMSTEYKLRDVFSSFAVPAEKWYDMREDQRRSHVQRVYKLAMSEVYAANPQHCVLVSHSDVQLPTLSITPELSGLGSIIPLPVLKGIWRKAALLLSLFENNVSSAPSKDPSTKVFCVQTQTDKSPIPYFVQMYCCSKCHASCSHVKVTCTCKMYRPNSICSHALVVAEKCGDLDSFLKWRVSQDKSYNFSSLATVNINTKSSGRKGNRQRQDRSQKKNQCSDASDNLWVENRQHIQLQPLVSGSTLPFQLKTGSTATNVPTVDDARHTLGVLSENIQQPRMHSSIPGCRQVTTGCPASNVPPATLPATGGQPIETLEEDDYLNSTFSWNCGAQDQPNSYLACMVDQTALFSSTEGTRNTHIPNIPYFADKPFTFQQQTEAPNHTRFSDSLAVPRTMMLGSCAHGLVASDMPVQSSNTGYLQQIIPPVLVPMEGCIHPGGSPNRYLNVTV